ncbi:CRISPR-associated helicase/endonuclease Cas3 [Actinopolyspora mortivallis]|uniref:CRISPR-associated helicase/endonuclease Cas3 n=2 Tax=Actinopolyspora mortivallis TaxID=33906 RepID=A0A2T0H113_ACTMO|nr:CRISPR-associated helicase/endonuclease Cas3 [Actinopolyspora mortivallis]
MGGARYPVACHGLDTAAAVRILWQDVVSAGIRTRLATSLGVSEPDACAILQLWAALHDIGKITPSFQNQVEIPPGYSSEGKDALFGHAYASHLWVPSALDTLDYPGSKRHSLSLLVGEILGGHHGRYHHIERQKLSQPKLFPYLGLGEEQWEQQRQALLRAFHEILTPPVPARRMRPCDAVLATGLIILADWMISQTSFILTRLPSVPSRGDTSSLGEFFTGSLREIPRWVRHAGLSRLSLKPGSFSEEFPGFSPNTLQDSIATRLPELVSGPGLLMIAAPTGFGKTETTLHASRILGEAAGTAGLYFALPTMATSEQAFTRIARYLFRRSQYDTSTSLLHGMAWLSPVEEMLAQASLEEGISSDESNRVWFSDWLRGAKKALLASAGIGTIDQALLSVLPVRHNSLRLFSLANKTVVIDEVHAFSPYMLGLLKTLLAWLGHWGVPVVLMSATLPQHVAGDLTEAYLGKPLDDSCSVPYPGWTYVERGSPPHRVSVHFPDKHRRTVGVALRPVTSTQDTKPDRMPALSEELQPVAEHGGCAAVICTTVDQAQRTYQDLTAWAGKHDIDVKLLHSRFPDHERESRTNEIMRDFGNPSEKQVSSNLRNKKILVATQVIEQSLDLDFDLILTDLAPFELILQRIGRLQRHPALDELRPDWASIQRGGQRRAVVLTPPANALSHIPEMWKYIYPEISLIRAQRLLQEHESSGITIPDDVQTLVDRANPGKFSGEDELTAEFTEADIAHEATVMVEEQSADRRDIPIPSHLSQLADLSKLELEEEQATTRFNADSVRVLPLFVDSDERLHLGCPSGPELPAPEGDRLTRDQAVAIMRHTIPVPGSLVRDRDESHRLPEPWRKLWPVQDLVVLRQPVDASGQVHPARVGKRAFVLDPDLGLREVS